MEALMTGMAHVCMICSTNMTLPSGSSSLGVGNSAIPALAYSEVYISCSPMPPTATPTMLLIVTPNVMA